MQQTPAPATLLHASPDGMGRAVVYLALEAGEDGQVEPPAERLLFGAGETPTTKGTFRWTKRSVSSVREMWNAWTGGQKQRGRADYEHQMAHSGSVPGHEVWTAAMFDLDISEAGCKAVNISWLDPAPDLIRSRKKDGTSPWFAFDAKTGEILAVLNFGLVCLPATFGQAPLVTASAGVGGQGPILAPPDHPDLVAARETASYLLWHSEGLLSAWPASSARLLSRGASGGPAARTR